MNAGNRGLFLALLVLFFLPGPGAAQDRLGLFFDEAGAQTDAVTTSPYQPLTAYLILQEPSFADGIRSWECVVEARTTGPAPVITWQLSGQAINAATAPAFLVGLGQLLPSDGDVLLATATVLVPEAGQEIAFFIHPFDPPSLQDPPVWGYPVFAPVYGHGATGELTAAGWYSGCEASPAAVVNTDGAGESWELAGVPAALDFNYMEIGETAELHFQVSLQGEGPVSGTVTLSAPRGYRYRHGGGYFTDQPTTFRLEPDQDLDFSVRLAVTDSLIYQGQLVLDVCDRTFVVNMEGGYVEGNCQVPYPSHDYGVVPVGGEVRRGFLVVCTGGLLEIDPVIDDPAFTPSPPVGEHYPYLMHPGEIMYVYVTFAPLADGHHEAVMDLGPSACPGVLVQGEGSTTIPPECDQNITACDFGEVGVGLQDSEWVLIQNTGGNVLPVDLALAQQDTAFTMNRDPGLYELGPGDELQVLVYFQPPGIASYSAVLQLGDVCSDVAFTGSGRELNESYVVPQQLALPSTPVGEASQAYVTVYNNGETVIWGDLQIEGDPEITLLNPGPFSVSPQAQVHRYLSFQPQASGYHSATLSTGLPGGETVHVHGYGVPVLDGVHNQVGLYFDSEWTSSLTQTTQPDEVVTGYLVLHDPSTATGVAGLQMCLDVFGQAQILNWEVEGHAGAGFPGWCADLTLDAPLPPAPEMLLATLDFLVPLPRQNLLYLRPGEVGLPDYAAYIDAADGVTRVPVTVVDPPYLAIINEGMVDVQAPEPPAAAAAGGGVTLRWGCQDGAEGYHVYRRAGTGQPVRLTAAPVACSEGQASYSDRPRLPAGTALYYSTAMISGGQESARSGEVEVRLDAELPRAAALGACYPNPFNPETRLPFVLDRPGQVRLAVFDVGGRQIQTLVHEFLPAGAHESLWNGRDQAGRTVPSGTYYFRLQTSAGVFLRKGLLLK